MALITTPGPWGHLALSGDTWMVGRSGHRLSEPVVATVHLCEDDARLIAAAPEMLATLRWIAHTAGQAYHGRGPALVAAEMEKAARQIVDALELHS